MDAEQEPTGTAKDKSAMSRTPPPVGGAALVFAVAGQRYGLPVRYVLRIVEMVSISKLPAAPEFIAGVIDFQGLVIPVVDLRKRFGQPAAPYTLNTPLLISQIDGRTASLVVDEVCGVVELLPEQIVGVGEVIGEELLPQTRYLAGVARTDDGLLLLLDPPTLFSAPEAQALARAARRRESRTKDQP